MIKSRGVDPIIKWKQYRKKKQDIVQTFKKISTLVCIQIHIQNKSQFVYYFAWFLSFFSLWHSSSVDYFILPLLGIGNFNAAYMIKNKTKQNFNATDQPEFQTHSLSPIMWFLFSFVISVNNLTI